MKNYFIYLVLLFFLIAIPVSSQDKLTKIFTKRIDSQLRSNEQVGCSCLLY